MTNDEMWNDETPVSEHGIDVPAWIEQDISPNQVASIVQGGCASGAYMPAVTYHSARETMAEHGDDVLEYIEDAYGSAPAIGEDSWNQYACTLLSLAVELWASNAYGQLEDIEPATN